MMEKDLNSIAKDISELADMPNDETYYEACVLVAEDLYDLDYENACKVADIIQVKYLNDKYNPNETLKKQAIDKIVDLSETDRLELFGYLLAKHSEIYETIIKFNPS